MILHSPRIDIKPLPLKDLQALVRSRKAFEEKANLTVTGVELPENYRDELTETIEQNPQVWDTKHTDYLFYTIWLMIEKESKTIIGQFTFNGKPNHNGEVEIFFSIESPYRRKGYATEVMETILCWGNKTQLFRVVLIEAFEENKAAMASLTKLGFRKVEVDNEIELSSKYFKVVCPKGIDCEDLDFDE